MHHFGSGIWSQMRFRTGAILSVTVPATIMRSDCRGLGRKTSAPKRAISKRDVLAAIISMAQQAKPNVRGQMQHGRSRSGLKRPAMRLGVRAGHRLLRIGVQFLPHGDSLVGVFINVSRLFPELYCLIFHLLDDFLVLV